MCAVPEGMTSADVIVWGEGGTFAQQIAAGRHRLKGDEPDSAGGTDTGPSPYDFLLAALGSCTSMTVGMYAREKNWPLERVPGWLLTPILLSHVQVLCPCVFDILRSLNRRKLATGEFRGNDLQVANAIPRLNLD